MSNDLLSIPCVLMRGGTSKGPFFLASDLPADIAERDRLLVEVMGSGHPLQIDGIGGGNALTITGAADIDGAFSGLTNLSVSGASNIGAIVSNTGTQTYAGAVTLSGGDRTLTGSTINKFNFLCSECRPCQNIWHRTSNRMEKCNYP